MKGDELKTRLAVGRRGPYARELLRRGAHHVEGRGNRRRERAEIAVGVDQRQVGVGIEQRLMLVLPVQLDQPAGQLLER